MLSIEFETPSSQDGRLEVFSMMGQRLRTQEVPAGTSISTLPLNELPNGVYLLRVMDAQKALSTQKFTVLH